MEPPRSTYRFSADVFHVLTEAGWYQGRVVEVPCCPQTGVSLAQLWPAVICHFLREFAGLHLCFIRRDDSVAHLSIDVQRAADHADHARIADEYAARVGTALYLIGNAYTENLLLLMDANGLVYGAFDEELYRIADHGPAAIEAICLDLPFRELPQ